MSDYINPETDFIRNVTATDCKLNIVEQSALNLLVELSNDGSIDKDLFSIAIILELTVGQVLNVKSAYITLFNEDLG